MPRLVFIASKFHSLCSESAWEVARTIIYDKQEEHLLA